MTNFAKVSSLIFLDNMRCIGDLIFGGVCHRFPDLKLVSVESGVGWIPAALETFDWQWRNGGVRDEHPEYDLLPSEYFRRQIYGCFWFEQQVALDAIAQYPDNILFESDYPHPTCQHPGPRTPGQRPRDYAQERARVAARRRRAQGAARQRRVGLPARRDADARRSRISGAGTSSRTSPDRVLHLRVDRVEKRNAFTQDMYRGIKRAAIWADRQPELDAVCLTGTGDWFGVGGDLAGARRGPRGSGRGVGRHRPLPVPPHRALPQALGGEDQRRLHRRRARPRACTAT